ncbi:hypothetical protein [Clostridium sp.]|uniref:hypothetical protein n=1 Tax=Clostridium sp. TaxID=1506 RepID=UPI0025BFCDA0|nr:hypothetical protein [Clostridium sp.]
MRISNEKLLSSVDILSKLMDMDLNIRVSYILARNISTIEKEITIYNNEREKLIKKYGVKDENENLKLNEDNTIQLKNECIGNWNRDIKDLLDLEIDVNIELIDKEDLFKCNCNISARELILIDYMIK